MKIGIYAANGKMGKDLIKNIDLDKRFSLASAFTRSTIQDPIYTNNYEKFCTSSEVIIDFSRPEGSMELFEYATKFKKPVICGTTGFTKEEFSKMEEIAKIIPIVYGENMSIGVNITSHISETAAKKLYPDYDVEILEMHHNQKVDSPSGTALMLGKNISKAVNINFDDNKTLDRNLQHEKRKKGSIGFASLRGGAVIGEHKVIFAGENDIIEITHRSFTRSIYSKGALEAALWVKDKAPKLYSIRDVLES